MEELDWKLMSLMEEFDLKSSTEELHLKDFYPKIVIRRNWLKSSTQKSGWSSLIWRISSNILIYENVIENFEPQEIYSKSSIQGSWFKKL
jgi:hypothetical protein